MTSDDRVIEDISRKIDREKIIIAGVRKMRNSTSNTLVQQKCDSNIHESEKNIEYLEERLRQLQVRKRNSLSEGSTSSPSAIMPQNSVDPRSPYSSNSTPPGMVLKSAFKFSANN